MHKCFEKLRLGQPSPSKGCVVVRFKHIVVFFLRWSFIDIVGILKTNQADYTRGSKADKKTVSALCENNIMDSNESEGTKSSRSMNNETSQVGRQRLWPITPIWLPSAILAEHQSFRLSFVFSIESKKK